MTFLPAERELTIGFAHAAYQMQDEFGTRGRAARSFEVRSLDELRERAPEADVLVVSGLWRNDLLPRLPKLRFIQSISAGTDQFDKAALAQAGVRLASAQGSNERAVAEHAMSLILALALLTAFVTIRLRRMPIGRAWEALREDEIACRSLGINTVTTKLTAFATGAMFGGFAGSFFAARQGFVSPESFVFLESAVILAIVVLGGMGSLVGIAIAAAVMVGGTEILRELEFLKNIFGDDFTPELYRMLLFGIAMVVVMVWKPRGFVGSREPTAFLRERKVVSGSFTKEGHG